MCGIVSYFGPAGAGLNRVVAGMSAIIYRAPDSTGVGLFGNERRPLVAAKSLGSVTDFLAVLTARPMTEDRTDALRRLWSGSSAALESQQQRVLRFEGFEYRAAARPLTLDDILGGRHQARVLTPGDAGRPGPLPAFVIRSRKDLREVVRTLTGEYDLPPAAAQAIIRNALADRIAEAGRPLHDAEPRDLLEAFDRLFEKTYYEDLAGEPPIPGRLQTAAQRRLVKTFWPLLVAAPVRVPEDFDRDAVRGLFRLLDGRVLAFAHRSPRVLDALAGILAKLAPPPASEEDFLTLYQAEKGVNVYGWAAAAALIYGLDLPVDRDACRVHDQAFHRLTAPVLGHGRWALQAAVTVENAHPFFDWEKRRAVVLNGQFNGEVEERVKSFLLQAGIKPRTGNSTEYLALLWAHYFDALKETRDRCHIVQRQIETGFSDLALGSQTIDFRVFHEVRDKSDAQIDEIAFLTAVKRMVQGGGQAAACGVSLYSPQRMYVAAHNRPVFVARRALTDEFMVVSDVNAALGLFPQRLILEKTRSLHRLAADRRRMLESGQFESPEAREERLTAYQAEEAALLKTFQVDVTPLEGEEVFACLTADGPNGRRNMYVTDFQGQTKPEVESFPVTVTPLRERREEWRSFFAAHLDEIPERLQGILAAYLPPPGDAVHMDLRRKRLRRRFGRKLSALSRIVLVGQGGYYHVAGMARPLFQKLLPHQEILTVKPAEVDDAARTFDADKDLVVLLSYTGSSAGVVQLARELSARQTAMIGVTEKPFSDMALIAQKSIGVIPLLCGEEITYSAVKSSAAMLLVLDLLALWLAERLDAASVTPSWSNLLYGVVDAVGRVNRDPAASTFAHRLALQGAMSPAGVVIDGVETNSVGREVAAKLEETSWSALGKPADYQDLPLTALTSDQCARLVVVGATLRRRLDEALTAMKTLYLADIPFAAVSYYHQEKEQVRFFSRGLDFYLPKADDELQPLIDMVFYYRLAHEYGLVHGRAAGFPRNRAKSVTVARGAPQGVRSAAAEAAALSKGLPEGRLQMDESLGTAPSFWEQNASFDWEKQYYAQVRRLAGALRESEPLTALAEYRKADWPALTEAVFGESGQEGELVFLALDEPARAAAFAAASILKLLIPGLLRVDGPEGLHRPYAEDAVVLALAERPVDERWTPLIQEIGRNVHLWLGPEVSPADQALAAAANTVYTPRGGSGDGGCERLYLALMRLLIKAWRPLRPDRARALQRALQTIPAAVDAVLNDQSLFADAEQAMIDNEKYKTAYFIGPPLGPGAAWMRRFDQSGALILSEHLYGEGAYGPITTVDPNFLDKYVQISPRIDMVEKHGEETVAEWERRYLGGLGVDEFMEKQAHDGELAPAPFWTEAGWRLPVIDPDYDADQDALIMVDAASDRRIDRAVDVLGLYGARYARMLFIAHHQGRRAVLRQAAGRYPVGHVLTLPEVDLGAGPFPINEPALPLAMNLTACRLAAAACRVHGKTGSPVEEADLVRASFGLLGDYLIKLGVRLADLEDSLIEALMEVSLATEAVLGASEYRVKTVHSLQTLNELAEKGDLFGAEEVRAHYQARVGQDLPFYLVYPEQDRFVGLAADLAEKHFTEDYWGQWFEVYGDTWRGLYWRRLEVQRDPDGGPLIELPLLKTGRLHHINVRFREWGHDQDLEAQLDVTLGALGRDARRQDPVGLRYVRLTSSFNKFLVGEGVLWEDWLLTLCRRSHILGRSTGSLAQLLAERTRAVILLGSLSEAETAVRELWPRLDALEDLDDDARFNALHEALAARLDQA